MPIRGETVGTAYVRILADGSSLPDDIEDQLRDHADAFRAAGERDAQAYTDAYEKHMNVPGRLQMEEALFGAIADADITREFFEGDRWKDFEREMEVRFGEVGRR